MPLSASDVSRAADTLFEARRTGRKLDFLPDDHRPVTEAEGYAVQAALLERLLARGSRVIGYKIGATNPAARSMLGTRAPFSAVLLSDRRHESPASLSAQDYHVIIIEPEIALRLGRDLPAAHAPHTPESVADAVDAVIPAIEIVTSPFPVWNKAGIGPIIADNGANGCWIGDRPVSDWHRLDLPGLPVTLSVGDRVVAEGAGRNVDGGPMIGLAWLANRLSAAGTTLRAGEVVTTGSATAPVPGSAGQEITADFGPLGSCRLSIR